MTVMELLEPHTQIDIIVGVENATLCHLTGFLAFQF